MIVIGFGFMEQAHAGSLLKTADAELTAIVDPVDPKERLQTITGNRAAERISPEKTAENSDLKRCGKYFAKAVIGEGDLDLKAFRDMVDSRGSELCVTLEPTDFAGKSSAEAVLKKTAVLLRNW